MDGQNGFVGGLWCIWHSLRRVQMLFLTLLSSPGRCGPLVRSDQCTLMRRLVHRTILFATTWRTISATHSRLDAKKLRYIVNSDLWRRASATNCWDPAGSQRLADLKCCTGALGTRVSISAVGHSAALEATTQPSGRHDISTGS